MRHCRPPASCRANFTYSGVPRGGRSALGPSLSSSSAARLALRPWEQAGVVTVEATGPCPHPSALVSLPFPFFFSLLPSHLSFSLFFFSLSTVSLYLSLPLPLSLYFSFSLLSLTSLLLSLSPSLCFSIYTSSLSHVSSPLFPLLLHLPPHPLLSGDSHTFLSPCSSFLSIIPSLCLPTPSSPWWRWSGTSAPAQTLIAGGHSGDDGTRHSLSGSHSPTLPTA